MFGLESSSCAGELVFMERYREVLQELAQVEQKIESQSLSSSSSSEGLGAVAAVVAGQGRSRLGSSGRSTLQAIGSAAAAGTSPQNTHTHCTVFAIDSKHVYCPHFERKMKQHDENIRFSQFIKSA